VSEHFAGEIRQVLRLPRSRLAVVPNCFSPDTVLDESEISPMKPYLLFIGVHLPSKNLQGLLNAWPIIRERFPHSQLVVRSNLTTEEQASCPESVVVQGERLERSALDDLIRTASALVWPSFHEGFGLPVLEAMALGTPVLVNLGTALEEVDGEGALLFDPASADSIAATCCKAQGFTPSQKEEQRQRCRLQAEEFLPTRILPQLLRLTQQTRRDQ
jgi:glycosyltransferase involved in cell wall biosynthesis